MPEGGIPGEAGCGGRPSPAAARLQVAWNGKGKRSRGVVLLSYSCNLACVLGLEERGSP